MFVLSHLFPNNLLWCFLLRSSLNPVRRGDCVKDKFRLQGDRNRLDCAQVRLLLLQLPVCHFFLSPPRLFLVVCTLTGCHLNECKNAINCSNIGWF
jgi:hypothetical protein